MANLAHIAQRNGERAEQTVADHVLHAAAYAAEKLKPMGLSQTGYLAGVLHDMGKCTAKYQAYLERAARGEAVARGSVNHTFCGCIYLLRRYHAGRPQGFDTMTCEILAYAVGAHHGQFDCVTPDGVSGFEHRLKADAGAIGYDEAVAAFLSECVSEEEIDRLFSLAQGEVTALFQVLQKNFRKKTPVHFLMGLTARMVLSAVIDGDRRDTAEFMSGAPFHYREGSPELWAEQIDFLDRRMADFGPATPINQARRRFSEQCRTFAQTRGGGIYRLTLPTGGGKTLSSLRYALYHAKTFGKKRILFVIPLLSILEQNSAVLRDALKDPDILIEHHSNVVKDFATEKELDRYELLAETWESPVVVTTLVQLLNALFAGKTTAVRRMSALCDCVLLIDEVQSLPKKVTDLFTMAMNFLVFGCGATVVLSSATQPCFAGTGMPLRYSEPADLALCGPGDLAVFRRTDIVDRTSPYGMSPEELAEFSAGVLEGVSSLLIICNTKDSAAALYRDLRHRCGGCAFFYLSAAMCPAHRSDTLRRVSAALTRREKLLCVSTQLVEAGVDFSFESVIRVAAGLDNVAQAAGRCNRSFDFGRICKVYLVNLRQDAEKLAMLREIAAAQRCTGRLLEQFAENPERYGGDLLSGESIAAYYESLFQDPDIRGKFAFPLKLPYGMTENLFDLLAANETHVRRTEFEGRYFLNQAFQTAGDRFQVFDESTDEVIVPYDAKAEALIADLFSQKSAFDYGFLQERIRQAKPYTVQVFAYQKAKLTEYGMLSSPEGSRFLILDKQCYHPEIGLHTETFIL